MRKYEMPDTEWGCIDVDPVQDLIDAFWTKNAESELEKYGKEFVKRMIPKDRWPIE